MKAHDLQYPGNKSLLLRSMEEEGSRKRKSHKKSRQGCGNCKLRRVKCDETRPKCRKCISFGVSCNYDPKATDLQMSYAPDGTFSIKRIRDQPHPINQTIFSMTKAPACPYPIIIDNFSGFQLDSKSLDRLTKFQMRTVLSIGTEKLGRLCQKEVIPFTREHPFLMHVVQALTLLHDRFLSGSPITRKSTTEVCYHWSRAAALFNQKLSIPIPPRDRDAVWSAASLMGIIAFAAIEASTPEEAWPLRPSDPTDLEWLKMSDGKMSVWELTNPLRPDSLFYVMKDTYLNTAGQLLPPPSFGSEAVPHAFIELYGLDESSTADNNPYHATVHILAPLLLIECEVTTIPMYFSFTSHMHPVFKRLVEQKDPRALLLMAYWYARVCSNSVWWTVQRSRMECQAICIYLERYHPEETMIQELLLFPKMLCGLAS